jgi:hypothetical protein
MGGFEKDDGPQENLAFLHDECNFPGGCAYEDFMELSLLAKVRYNKE